MNFGIIKRILGNILVVESIFMLPSLFISLYTKEGDGRAFIITILITSIVGLFLSMGRKGKGSITAKDGLAIVALGWTFMSLLGALPLYLTGSTRTYIDAVFEIVSGFTTTGATLIPDVESLSMGILFWRSFTHWIGGMGIIVFTLALLPALGVGGIQIFKAESTGPVVGKMLPRVRDTAKILYIIYFALTVIPVILLKIGGMTLFESLVYTFGTVGTGGFSTKNSSVGAYSSNYIHIVIGTFMLLSGVSFSLYYALLKGKFKEVFKDQELRLYIFIVATAVVAIGINLYMTNYGSLLLSFKDSYFQVSSIITTAGFSTANFDLWPSFSKAILVLLMFVGGCAGSTAGGIKVIRILILLKLIKRDILKMFHPRAVIPIKLNGKVVKNETIAGINSFVSLYFIIIGFSTILISLEGVDLVSAFTSVATTLGNVGPGLNFVGPTNTFVNYSQASKAYFAFLMLLGRLELFTIIALLAPRNWKKVV